MKIIFCTGGVMSSLGKGITIASLAMLLKSRGYRVTVLKCDPYLNVDAGTMSPYQHGEVFVTFDGAETDLDLGHYERFLNENLSGVNNLTSGKVYWEIIARERRGEYLGATVQVVPHVVDLIKEKIYSFEATGVDFLLVEIGGTVGDIEGLPFLEAARQILNEREKDAATLHVSYVPFLETSGEFKTKPTQHSVKELLGLGIKPTFLVARAKYRFDDVVADKLAKFCNVKKERVFIAYDAPSIYEVPMILEEQGLAKKVLEYFGEGFGELGNYFKKWREFTLQYNELKREENKKRVAIVGKYVDLPDAYLSVSEALIHASVAEKKPINVDFISSEREDLKSVLSKYDGIVIPGGFGDRGVEGKIMAIRFARENDVPLLGLCLGMQCILIEFARNVLGYSNANSTEFTKECVPVVDRLVEYDASTKGGTMRLGAFPVKIVDDYLKRIYSGDLIYERHRHRYGYNNIFRDEFERKGLLVAAVSVDERIVEAIVLPDKRFFVGVQYHPEFASRPLEAHPLFVEFVRRL